MKKYQTPDAEKLLFDDDVISASSGNTKNPGNHSGCASMPNGKPIPEHAKGAD